jgi:acyl-CoA reductase-like NAD-dependent aldehyde dehydrogenase
MAERPFGSRHYAFERCEPPMNLQAQSPERILGPLIDGVILESEGEGTVEVINPSTGEKCVSIPAGSEADVGRAVSRARAAFEDGRWSGAAPSFRKKTLHQLADLVEREAAAFDALDAEEMGKPVREALFSASSAAGLMRFYAEAVDKLTGDVYSSDKQSFVTQRRVPRGVVAAIVPWNFPTYIAVLKVAPALAAGNSVVLKPSELSSRSAIRLGQLAVQAGLPPGVLNIVPGRGETVGRALGMHDDVDMVTFTGSTDVGKRMLQYAGQSNMKVVMAECGGKSPHVVFGDGVDLDAVGAAIARMLLSNQGQICSVGSRLLVHRSIEETFLRKVTEKFGQIVMGDALHPNTTFGPLASAEQCARVMRYIDIAQAEGAELVTGGRRVMIESGGYFVEPTAFRAVSTTSQIAQEEIFGPVLSVIPFDDEADAIGIANSTKYGLAAYVWTKNLSTAMNMARGIRSSVRINAVAQAGEGAGYMSSYEPAAQSGVGTEGGLAGMESYLRRQRIWINHG